MQTGSKCHTVPDRKDGLFKTIKHEFEPSKQLETITGWGFCDQPRPEAEADYTCRDLDYSGYHTEFNYCFIILCFLENIQKLLFEMQVDFFVLLNTRTNAPSGRISVETIQVLSLFSQRCITHARIICTIAIIMLVYKITPMGALGQSECW